jgi:hypothetical protein
MRALKLGAFGVSIVAFGMAFAPRASAAADSWDEFTYITFSAPVQIPGHALPAGTYLFQLADIWSNQETIEIYTGDKSMLVARVVTQPVYNYEPPQQRTIITFKERPANVPEALREWFPRGQRWGHLFVYTEQQRRARPETLGSR